MSENDNDNPNDVAIQALTERVGDIFSKAMEGFLNSENQAVNALSKIINNKAEIEKYSDDDVAANLSNPYYNTILDQRWKLNQKPMLMGKRFVIANSWRKEEVARDPQYANLQLIQIDPGIAFGRFHETTQVCIDAIEKYWHGGRMLDIGTGTAILAMAGHFIHPDAEIDAFDISQNAVEHARLHLKLNALTDKIALQTATIDKYPAQAFDFVIGNLLPDIVVNLKTELIARVKPAGLLVLSGIRADAKEGRIGAQFDWARTSSSNIAAATIASMFNDEGMETVEIMQRKEWTAIVLRAAGN